MSKTAVVKLVTPDLRDQIAADMRVRLEKGENEMRLVEEDPFYATLFTTEAGRTPEPEEFAERVRLSVEAEDLAAVMLMRDSSCCYESLSPEFSLPLLRKIFRRAR